jgi:nuclear transport factor 2 (NTF2) superfamily protein
MATRPPTPPFSHCTGIEKVPLAEDAWNRRDPEKVDSQRKYHWPLGRRPDDHPGLCDLGF